MQDALENRMILGGLIISPVAIGIWSVGWVHKPLEAFLDMRPWAHMTLEALLNVFWVVLAYGAFLRWFKSGQKKNQHCLPAFISLIFAFALLFPVISANDDLLQQELINDCSASQPILTALKINWQLSHRVSSAGFTAAKFVPQFPLLSLGVEHLRELAPVAHDAPAIRACGNHSPPFC